MNRNEAGTILPREEDTNFRCGIARLQIATSSFIIGGVTTELQEFPFSVLLIYDSPGWKLQLNLAIRYTVINLMNFRIFLF